MSNARVWRALAFCGWVAAQCGVARVACAAPTLSATENDATPPLARVEVAMAFDVERESLLFERIRSLFPAQTTVVSSGDPQLDQRALLSPQRLDTVYIWIRVTEPSARVYLTLAEQGEQTRYLFREIELDSGLDEVGSETLAEVAHSSAQALWLREQQSSRDTLVEALEREAKTEPKPESPPVADAPPIAAMAPAATVRDSHASAQHAAARREASALRLGVGATGTTHSSGSEGWLQEVGGFFAAEYRGRLSLRFSLRYLVPTDFGVPPARVHLTGASGEFRGGWLSTNAPRMRARLEAGLGALMGHAQASIIDEQPAAHALAGQDFHRGYALAAAGLEWPIGPAWVATSLDLRVPFGATSYEIDGQPGAIQSSALCPGGSLEVGVGFDPALR